MDVPGVADAMADPYMRGKAEEEAEKLLEELKKAVEVELKDIGVLRKEMRVSVPQSVIDKFLTHNIDELRQDAIVPGFRKGHAPRKLVEKRFGSDVRDSLKTMVLGQSYFAAIENNKLEVLGDPLIQITTGDEKKLVGIDEALANLTLPDSGNFDYVCEIEVKPEFELPTLEGIEVAKPVVTVEDGDIDEYVESQRKIRGRFEPVEGRGAEEGDMVVADVVLSSGGTEVKREENVQLGVRPQRLDGITLENLGEVLKGIETGQTRKTECTIPDDYERQDLRGKQAEFEMTAHEIKTLVPIALEDYLKQGGYENEAELRDFVRQNMEADLDQTIQDALKGQIQAHLMDKCEVELPEKLSARQADRAVTRKIIELQQRGVPFPDIEARIDELRTVAQDEAVKQLKMQFILDKVADKLEVEVTDEEVNTVIAGIARKYNRRFDRIRDELQQQGTLNLLADQIRHDKSIDLLLKDAKISDKPLEKKETTPPKKTAAKKTTEKATAEKPAAKPAVKAAPSAKKTTAKKKTATKKKDGK